MKFVRLGKNLCLNLASVTSVDREPSPDLSVAPAYTISIAGGPPIRITKQYGSDAWASIDKFFTGAPTIEDLLELSAAQDDDTPDESDVTIFTFGFL